MLNEEQLERYAGEVLSDALSKEEGMHYHAGGDAPPIYCAKVLVTDRFAPVLRERVAVSLGHLPEVWPSDYVTRHSNDRALSAGYGGSEHPIEYAAAFDEHPAVRQYFLDAHQKIIDHALETGDWHSAWHLSSMALPPPKDPALRFTQAPASVFHPGHASWYTPKAIVKFLEARFTHGSADGAILAELFSSCLGDPEAEQGMNQIILRYLEKIFDQRFHRYKNRDHGHRADVLAIAPSAESEALLANAADPYADLGACIQNVSEKTMIRALRMLAKYKRFGVLRRMSRPPTFEELKASNIRGAGEVWNAMPWELFEPVVRSQGSALRAELLKRTELSVSILRTVLTNHDQRFSRMEAPHTLASGFTPARERFLRLQRWALNYFPAIKLREALQRTYRPNTQQLVALYHLTKDEELAPKVTPILTPEVRACMAAHASPIERPFPFSEWLGWKEAREYPENR